MGDLSTSLIGQLNEIIPLYGESITFSRNISSYDPTNGDVISNGLLVFTGFAVRDTYSGYEIKDSLILATDVKLIVQPLTYIPQVGDIVKLNVTNTDYRVMNVVQYVVEGVFVGSECQLRV